MASDSYTKLPRLKRRRFSLLGNSLLDLGLDSSLSFGVGESEVSDPLLALGVLLDESTLSLGDLLADRFLLGSLCSSGALSDFSVNLLVEGLEVGSLSLREGFFPLGELSLEGVLVLLLQSVEVALDVSTEDVVSVLLGVVGASSLALLGDGLASLSRDSLLLLKVVAWESLGVVGNVDSAINSTLESTEDSVTGGGSNETNIEEGLEGASFLVDALLVHIEEFTVSSLNTLVDVRHAELGEESSGEEETGGVRGGVVCETSSETEFLELEGVSLSEDSISLNGGIDDLDDDSRVGPSHNKSVLLGIVLVLVLLDQSTSGLVVSLSLTSASELDLISGIVGSGLHSLNKTHLIGMLLNNNK